MNSAVIAHCKGRHSIFVQRQPYYHYSFRAWRARPFFLARGLSHEPGATGITVISSGLVRGTGSDPAGRAAPAFKRCLTSLERNGGGALQSLPWRDGLERPVCERKEYSLAVARSLRSRESNCVTCGRGVQQESRCVTIVSVLTEVGLAFFENDPT